MADRANLSCQKRGVMQIAFCLYKYFPYGGLQRDFLRIAQACQQQGHQVRVYTFSWQGAQPDTFDIISVPKKGWSNHVRNSHYFQWVTAHLRQYPVDRIVGFNKMPGLDVYYAADTCFAEKVAAEKGWCYRLTPRYKHYAAFEKAVFAPPSKTKLLMLTERQIAAFIHYYHTEADRFYILPPGIALDRKYDQYSAQRRAQFRQQQHLGDETIVLLQIGSDFHRKGVDRSLQAIAALPDALRKRVFFWVVGQDNAEKYQQQAQQLAITNQVRFFAGRDDVPDFLFAADLLLHPARHEAAGIVLVEALVSGTPVLVTDVCGYAFHINQAKAGQVLAEPFIQKTFNLALEHAIGEPTRLANWHQHALDYANHADLYSLPQKAAEIIAADKLK